MHAFVRKVDEFSILNKNQQEEEKGIHLTPSLGSLNLDRLWRKSTFRAGGGTATTTLWNRGNSPCWTAYSM